MTRLHDDDDADEPAVGLLPTIEQHPHPLDEDQILIGLGNAKQGAVLRDRLLHPRMPQRERDAIDFLLVKYSLGVLTSLILSGQIAGRFVRLTNCGHFDNRSLHELAANRHDVEDVVDESVVTAFRLFHQHLIDGKWQPNYGASLRTYYVNGCILAFKGCYDKWAADRSRLVPLPDDLPAIYGVVDDPADICELRQLLREFSERLEPTNRMIWERVAQGYAPREIVAELRLTDRAVEGRISRLKKKWSEFLSGRSE